MKGIGPSDPRNTPQHLWSSDRFIEEHFTMLDRGYCTPTSGLKVGIGIPLALISKVSARASKEATAIPYALHCGNAVIRSLAAAYGISVTDSSGWLLTCNRDFAASEPCATPSSARHCANLPRLHAEPDRRDSPREKGTALTLVLGLSRGCHPAGGRAGIQLTSA